MPGVRVVGRGFPQHRFGYLAEELEGLGRAIAGADVRIDRVVCGVPSGLSPWDAMTVKTGLPGQLVADGTFPAPVVAQLLRDSGLLMNADAGSEPKTKK